MENNENIESLRLRLKNDLNAAKRVEENVRITDCDSALLKVNLLEFIFYLEICEKALRRFNECVSREEINPGEYSQHCEKFNEILRKAEEAISMAESLISSRYYARALKIMGLVIVIVAIISFFIAGPGQAIFSNKKKKQTALLLNFPKCGSNLCNIS